MPHARNGSKPARSRFQEQHFPGRAEFFALPSSLYSSLMPTPHNLIITGASRGIGAAIALKAGRSDYRGVVNYAKDRQAPDQIVDQIREAGGHSISIARDPHAQTHVIP